MRRAADVSWLPSGSATLVLSLVAVSALLAAVTAGVLRLLRGRPVEVPDQTGKVVVVTGGNSGIGLATATELARAGATVVLTSREAGRGDATAAALRASTGNDRVEALPLDLEDLASVRAFAATLLARHPRLDVLIHNAGRIVGTPTTTVDGLEATLAANHLGPTLLTALLLDRLRVSAPSRVVVVASTAHRQGDLDLDDLMGQRDRYRPLAVYARSKLAAVLTTRELGRRLAGTGVTVNCCHPGTIRSGFGQEGDTAGVFRMLLGIARLVFPGPEVGARAPLYLATSPEVADVNGAYFDGRRRTHPSRRARDDRLARELWERTAALLDLPVDWVATAVDRTRG